jgi:molybdate transport system substrate-binding protein
MSNRITALILLMITSFAPCADTVQIAVAANFAAVLEKIALEYEKETGHKVVISSGSTGKLYSQIVNGAPFEVFLSADASTPAKLISENFAVAGSEFTYAVGKLVLWSSIPGFVDGKGQVLKQGLYAHLAIANPKTAPYGIAAIETLKHLEALKPLEDRLVYGENIAQTHQFVASGNAELGFVALSLVIESGAISKGSAWIVPENLYTPLRQNAVLLNTAKDKRSAFAFLEFLKGTMSEKLIKASGYTQ